MKVKLKLSHSIAAHLDQLKLDRGISRDRLISAATAWTIAEGLSVVPAGETFTVDTDTERSDTQLNTITANLPDATFDKLPACNRSATVAHWIALWIAAGSPIPSNFQAVLPRGKNGGCKRGKKHNYPEKRKKVVPPESSLENLRPIIEEKKANWINVTFPRYVRWREKQGNSLSPYAVYCVHRDYKRVRVKDLLSSINGTDFVIHDFDRPTERTDAHRVPNHLCRQCKRVTTVYSNPVELRDGNIAISVECDCGRKDLLPLLTIEAQDLIRAIGLDDLEREF